MNPAIEISLCVLAWTITLFRARTVIKNRVWKTDRPAFHTWLTSVFFSLTLTFFITPLSAVLNRYALPNLSRYLAYTFVALTLYFPATGFLITFPTSRTQLQLNVLRNYLILTLILLTGLYIFLVSRSPEWIEQAVPGMIDEMIFKLVGFTFAAVLCFVVADTSRRHLREERVTVTRIRMVSVFLTGVGGGTFFVTKIILALGYFWPLIGASQMYLLSKVLEVVTALFFFSSLLNARFYVKLLSPFRSYESWATYRDLTRLNDRLKALCPPIGMDLARPSFKQFLQNSDYYLYRAVVHILDGKTLISDYLNDTLPKQKIEGKWNRDQYLEAVKLNTALKGVPINDSYPELISAYRSVSRRLIRANG